jgi:hypothetical protein
MLREKSIFVKGNKSRPVQAERLSQRFPEILVLLFAQNSEHLRSAHGTDSCRGSSFHSAFSFHGDFFFSLHFLFLFALYAVSYCSHNLFEPGDWQIAAPWPLFPIQSFSTFASLQATRLG